MLKFIIIFGILEFSNNRIFPFNLLKNIVIGYNSV